MANAALVAFIEALNAAEDRRDAAEADIRLDILFLKDTIEKLNNVPGTFTPEEQALVDAALVRINGAAGRIEDLSKMTTPTPPTPPAEPTPV